MNLIIGVYLIIALFGERQVSQSVVYITDCDFFCPKKEPPPSDFPPFVRSYLGGFNQDISSKSSLVNGASFRQLAPYSLAFFANFSCVRSIEKKVSFANQTR